MLNNRGKVLRKVVDKYCDINKSSITAVAHAAGYNQSTIYRHFDKADLSYHIIRKYGRVMNHDFTIEFPEMVEDLHMVTEPMAAYGKATDLDDCIKQRDYWQSKYVDLLEKHNEMLTNYMQKPTS